jgi:hypothetical protein
VLDVEVIRAPWNFRTKTVNETIGDRHSGAQISIGISRRTVNCQFSRTLMSAFVNRFCHRRDSISASHPFGLLLFLFVPVSLLLLARNPY